MRDPHPLPVVDVVVDGLRLSTLRQGTQGAPCVLLLHGFATCAQLWSDVVRDLSRGFQVIAPDLVGCGRSERPAAAYSLETQARTMLRLLDELGIDQVLACGHGLGGAVAVHLAAIAPRRAVGLVLNSAALHADAWPPGGVLPLLPLGRGELFAAALACSPALANRFLARYVGVPEQGAGLAGPLDQCLGALRQSGSTRALMRFARSVDLAASEGAWQTVCSQAVRTLLLWGEQDQVASIAYGQRLAAEAPLGAWIPVPDAGHLLAVERPERVAEEISGFAAEIWGESTSEAVLP